MQDSNHLTRIPHDDEFLPSSSTCTSIKESGLRRSIPSRTFDQDLEDTPHSLVLDESDIDEDDVDDECVDYEELPSITNASKEYWDIDDPVYSCPHCGANFWFEERIESISSKKNPKYSLCCSHGKVRLACMKEPPLVLCDLIGGGDQRSKHFLENIRSYNSMFAFTSMGGKIECNINKGKSPPIFKLHGQNYHLIGSLLPIEGSRPKFAQLYIYDTENEIENRMSSV
ncbi:unnamed protein product, partial [Cuscuta europaea]